MQTPGFLPLLLFFDGVYVERTDNSLQFRWVKASTSAELTELTATVARRIGRHLERQVPPPIGHDGPLRAAEKVVYISYTRRGDGTRRSCLSAEPKSVLYEAELYRLKGALTLHGGDGEEAEACFRKAIDIAQHLAAKSRELRAATSLARQWREQGGRAGARELVSGIYPSFTEGLDTQDLRDSKDVLETPALFVGAWTFSGARRLRILSAGVADFCACSARAYTWLPRCKKEQAR